MLIVGSVWLKLNLMSYKKLQIVCPYTCGCQETSALFGHFSYLDACV